MTGFKVGDRVRIVDSYHKELIGQLATVTIKVDDRRSIVVLDDIHLRVVYEDEIGEGRRCFGNDRLSLSITKHKRNVE